VKDNIEMDFEEMRWEGVDWIYLAQDWCKGRNLVKKVMNPLVL
jgi:hypothetical protein